MPSSSAIAGFVLPNASSMPTFVCLGVAPLSRNAGGMSHGMFADFDRHGDETAFWVISDLCGECASRQKPFGFERHNAIGG